MFGSGILEVVIGLVFFYLLLGIICSALNEWIAGVSAARAKNLEYGIRNLLNDPQFEEKFYKHPLIKGLSRKTGKKPSYIPSRTFALALIDIIAPVDPSNGSKKIQDTWEMVATLPEGELKETLRSLMSGAGNDLKIVRQNIENWFDDTMERVSGWYKRKAQMVILVLAFVVSVGMNADTIMISNILSNDTTMRASVVATAQEMAKQPSPDNSESSLLKIKEIHGELQQFQLIGWSEENIPKGIMGWFMKIVGLLITTIAVSLGAPFWFDVLNKLINLRSAGKQPEKAAKG